MRDRNDHVRWRKGRSLPPVCEASTLAAAQALSCCSESCHSDSSSVYSVPRHCVVRRKRTRYTEALRSAMNAERRRRRFCGAGSGSGSSCISGIGGGRGATAGWKMPLVHSE